MAGLMQRFCRLLRHRWTEGKVSQAFPSDVLQRLEKQVAASESLHTGQVRLCVEGGLPYSYIWRDAPARERAIALFGKLRVWDTEHNNGVLIYLLMADHAIEIIADRGLHKLVPSQEWESVMQEMQQQFRQESYAQGLETALQRVTGILMTHYPSSTAKNAEGLDSNLPDAPVVQGRFLKDR